MIPAIPILCPGSQRVASAQTAEPLAEAPGLLPSTVSREEIEATRALIRAELGSPYAHAERAEFLEGELAKTADSRTDWRYIAACCAFAYLICALTKDWFAGGAAGMIAGLAVAFRVEKRRMRRAGNDA